MACRPDEVSRHFLLEQLAPVGVTSHKLMRWLDAGLLPKPRRHGLGRAVGGSISCYPRLALLQAAVLASLLRRRGKRNLDEAAWDLWVLGFPVTEYVRDLLLEDLELQRQAIEVIRRDPKRLKRELRLKRHAPVIVRLRKWIKPDHLHRVIQLLADLHLGKAADQYTDKEWQLAQDASAALMPPEYLDEEKLPNLKAAAKQQAHLSKAISFAKTIHALERVGRWWLEALRNEIQWFGQESGALVPRGPFLEYFKRWYVDPEGRRIAPAYRVAMGWKNGPPLSPLEQLINQHNQATGGVIRPLGPSGSQERGD
jgi:hypothetical protein